MNRQSQLHLIDTVPTGQERAYLPGLGKHWLTPFYDTLTRFAGLRRQQQRLIELADLAPGQQLLDVGCGTGNLLQSIARTVPGLSLAGLDPDRSSLERAGRKLRGTGSPATLFRGYADHLPYEDGSLDRVVSSLALHHLDPPAREAFATEAYRVLRPGGKIVIMDFDGRATGSEHSRGHGSRRHAPRPGGDDNLVRLLGRAGFDDASELGQEDSRMGTISYVGAARP